MKKQKRSRKDIRSAILTGMLAKFLPLILLAALVLKIRNELRFWDWLFHGMPAVPHRWYYVLSLIGTIIGFALCVMYAIVFFSNDQTEKNGESKVDEDEEEQ